MVIHSVSSVYSVVQKHQPQNYSTRGEKILADMQYLYAWFKKYTQLFYSDDPSVMSGILLKEEHSYRVAKNAADLALNLTLDNRRRIIAETAGLLHDLARYDQWVKFHSFSDPGTGFDHGSIGAEKLKNTGILKKTFSPDEEDIILFAIHHHNKLAIPDDSADKVLFTQILRDADKLDIFRIMPPIVAEHDYTPILIEYLQSGRPLPYTEIRTPADKRLVRLGWLYDINFSWTLKQLVKEGFADQLLSSLPDTAPFNRIRYIFKEYIHRKIDTDCKKK